MHCKFFNFVWDISLKYQKRNRFLLSFPTQCIIQKNLSFSSKSNNISSSRLSNIPETGPSSFISKECMHIIYTTYTLVGKGAPEPGGAGVDQTGRKLACMLLYFKRNQIFKNWKTDRFKFLPWSIRQYIRSYEVIPFPIFFIPKPIYDNTLSTLHL